MSYKVDVAQRCADLLEALARTANVRLTLKETGISATWAYRQRKADPDFDARWRTAVRAGRRDLARAVKACARDPKAARPGAGAGAGARLVIVGSSGKGTLRLERVKPWSFTDAKRAAFIGALRATCNVRAAARAAGVSAHAAYDHYHADAAFRALWDATLVEGRVHLEMALIASARALFEPSPVGGGAQEAPAPVEQPAGEGLAEEESAVAATPAVTGMDAKVALQLLRLHAPRDAAGRVRGRWVKPADAEETRRAILAKVAAVRAAAGGVSEQCLSNGRRGPGPSAGLGPGFRRGGDFAAIGLDDGMVDDGASGAEQSRLLGRRGPGPSAGLGPGFRREGDSDVIGPDDGASGAEHSLPGGRRGPGPGAGLGPGFRRGGDSSVRPGGDDADAG